MQTPGAVGPWLLATLLFLVLLGGGRTVRGRWLGRPPFGAGVALSVALGVLLYSLVLALFGHLGALGSPWPQRLLGLGGLVALPGLFWTWQDFHRPAPGLERGYGLGWFGPAAWLLLFASLALSFLWITGAFGFEARGLLFERVGIDYELGHVAYDAAAPRDPFLGDEPLDLWLYALGSAEASLAFSWWLGVALVFGVYGLGWRLHAQGAGLVAAMALAIVLFATDRPLFLAPALPATVALLAVMVLAVESRGRPNWGHSLVAGVLGGFALVSDLGAAAMLLPLLVFGPLWCKFASGRELARPEHGAPGVADGGDALDSDLDGDFVKVGEEARLGSGVKWRTPLKHTAIGAAGLSLPLLPWLARNEAWAGDPFYGLRHDFRAEYARRHRTDLASGLDLKVDYRFLDSREPSEDTGLGRSYLRVTEWGLGLGVATGFGLAYGGRRRRRQTLLYGAPAAVSYGLGAALGDFELTHPASLALLSVTTGSTLYTLRGCGPLGRHVAFGTALTTGGLALGLSGASDCGYWDELDVETWKPTLRLDYAYYDEWGIAARHRPPDETGGDGPKLQLEYEMPKLDLGLRYEYAPEAGEEPAGDVLEVPVEDLREIPAAEYRLPGEADAETEEKPAAGQPARRPTLPGHRPDVRPDRNARPRGQPSIPRY